MPTTVSTVLPPLERQAERLIELGIHELANLSPRELRDAAGAAGAAADAPEGSLLVVHETWAPPSRLTPLLERDGKPGFVVVDLPDLDDFVPIAQVALPEGPVYTLQGVDRGDHLANWSPDEALPALTDAGRTPLTVGEGIQWVLQQPAALERGRCFMTIASRRRKAGGRLDTRTPAVWISNGTGRDGTDRRGAPKVGWCWAGNRHTWLGFASATDRRGR